MRSPIKNVNTIIFLPDERRSSRAVRAVVTSEIYYRFSLKFTMTAVTSSGVGQGQKAVFIC